MTREFIQTNGFIKDWADLGLGDKELRQLEEHLISEPDAGDMIRGAGGVRKVRVAFPNRGKSGSGRVLYIDLILHQRIYLLAAFAKNEKENLTDAETAILRQLAKQLKGE